MMTAAIAASALGDNTLVAADANKQYHVKGFYLSASGAVNAKFKSGAATDLTGLLYQAAAGDSDADRAGGLGYLFETAVGDALVLNLSAAVAVGGYVIYDETS